MIIAYHAIFTTYGTWLPNDPRGSFSSNVYNEELKLLAPIRYGRQYPQPSRATLRRFWTETRSALKRSPFFFNDDTRPVVGRAFAEVGRKFQLCLWACAIMNDHVHLLVARSKYKIEYLAGQFKGVVTRKMGLQETPWARNCWKIFINNEKALYAAATYINNNPVSAGMPPQHWPFVTPLPPNPSTIV